MTRMAFFGRFRIHGRASFAMAIPRLVGFLRAAVFFGVGIAVCYFRLAFFKGWLMSRREFYPSVYSCVRLYWARLMDLGAMYGPWTSNNDRARKERRVLRIRGCMMDGL